MRTTKVIKLVINITSIIRHRSSSLEVSSSRAPATSTPILRQPSYRGPLVSQHSQHTSRREAATLRRGLSSEFEKIVANKTT